jgi:hypothetical protein
MTNNTSTVTNNLEAGEHMSTPGLAVQAIGPVPCAGTARPDLQKETR